MKLKFINKMKFILFLIIKIIYKVLLYVNHNKIKLLFNKLNNKTKNYNQIYQKFSK